jgi:hypothetical protein
MRLPDGLRGPPELPRFWIVAGAGVIALAALVALAMPWRDIGRRVLDSDLPRPRFHGVDWCREGCIKTGDFFVFSVDRHGLARGFTSILADNETAIPPDALDAWIRESRDRHGGRGAALLLRAHRHAPWSSVARVLESAVRTEHEDVRLQVGAWNFLRLHLLFGPSAPPAGEITITAVPLPDPQGSLATTRACQNSWGGPRPTPLLHLDVGGDPDVEAVLHVLECYAGDSEPEVRLSLR